MTVAGRLDRFRQDMSRHELTVDLIENPDLTIGVPPEIATYLRQCKVAVVYGCSCRDKYFEAYDLTSVAAVVPIDKMRSDLTALGKPPGFWSHLMESFPIGS